MPLNSKALFAATREFLIKRPLGFAGAAIIVLMALSALLANWVAPYHPLDIDYAAMLQAPGASHWLGTDTFGRDVLSRLLEKPLLFLGRYLRSKRARRRRRARLGRGGGCRWRGVDGGRGGGLSRRFLDDRFGPAAPGQEQQH